MDGRIKAMNVVSQWDVKALMFLYDSAIADGGALTLMQVWAEPETSMPPQM